MNSRRKILVMADWFSPGYKAGGPIRSCVNFVQHMKDHYDVYVFTGDRDLGDKEAYRGIITNQWIYKNEVYLFYTSPGYLNRRSLLQIIKELNPDFIYLNSMFSKYFSIYPLLLKRQGKIDSKVILAPRGMLKESAVSFKPFKKRLFLRVLRAMQVQKYISFQATDITEMNDVKKYFGSDAEVKYVPNFPGAQKAFIPVKDKQAGVLKIAFVGRVHPIKNLDFLLRVLRNITAHIELTVIGSIEDMTYKEQCDELIRQLPHNIKVNFSGDIPHDQLEEQLIAHHLFCLPTQGENFGHAIFEALSAGKPVLISDQTPWKGLQRKKAGWDFSLDNASDFTKAIEAAAAMDTMTLNEWSKGAWEYCSNYLEQSDIKNRYVKLFQ